MDYQETLDYIHGVGLRGSIPGLERISALMELLGNPQDNLKYIHIGGTNGKGSASAFLSYILVSAGLKVGLYTSPFIHVYNERMQINNVNIGNEELAEIATYVRSFADTLSDPPTEFEINTAIAFEFFSRNNCDIVVLEVGMGGEFDATNIIKNCEAAILMSISLDHTEYLGDTVEKIAATKSGIIKKGCQVVLYKQNPSVMDVIKNKCSLMGAELSISEPENLTVLEVNVDGQTIESKDFGRLNINLPGAYQVPNLAVVLKTVQMLKKLGYDISDDAVRKGLEKTRWPGRFELLGKDPVFLVDGGHNPDGIIATAQSLKNIFRDKKITFIFGVMADKNYREMLEVILPMSRCFYCVVPDNKRALDSLSLAKVINDMGGMAIPCDSIEGAVLKACTESSPDDVICTIGSLYIIGDIKRSYLKIT